MTRRTVVLAIGVSIVAAACGGTSGPASEGANGRLTKVEMRLDWVYQGPNSGFMAAQRQGFYRDVGLDVDIRPGEGSATTAQLVANGSAKFGFSDGYVVAQYVARGAPVRMVASIYRGNPNGVITLAGSDITQPMELSGKSVGIPPGSSQSQQWPAFVQGCGIEEGSVRVVNVNLSSAVQALLQGKVDAIAGYVQGFLPNVEIQGGKQGQVLWYKDCGVVAVSNGIIVQPSLIEENPDLIRRFVEASIRGFLYARENQQAAAVESYDSTIDPTVTMRQMELSWQTWVTPNTTGKPLGWMSTADWRSMLEILQSHGGVDDPPSPDQLSTNQFVPEQEQFVPPQQ